MNSVKAWLNKKRTMLCVFLLIILSLILVKQIISFVSYFNLEDKLGYEVSDLRFELKNKNYPELLDKVSRNEGRGLSTVTDTTEYVAIAKYYQAAIHYKAYQNQDQDKAEAYLRIMNENEKKIESDYMKKELSTMKQVLNI